MALDYLSAVTTLFGASAVLSGTGSSATITFKPSELVGTFGAPETAKPEAFLLALLQKANAAQGVTAARCLEVSKTTVITTKDNVQVTGEQYTVRVYSGAGVSPLDPDSL